MVFNKPSFLSRILHQLMEYDFSKVIIVTGYNSHLIEDEIKKFQLPIKTVFNGELPSIVVSNSKPSRSNFHHSSASC